MALKLAPTFAFGFQDCTVPAPEAPMAAPAPGQPAEQVQARFQIAAMEGVLERAVQLGAQTMRVKVQQVAPEMIFINGAPRARGFWLDGYGVFFDVDVPALRRSVLWSARTLDQGDHNRLVELRDLKAQATSVTDPEARHRLLLIINRLEQLEPAPGEAGGPRKAQAGGLTTAAHTTETFSTNSLSFFRFLTSLPIARTFVATPTSFAR